MLAYIMGNCQATDIFGDSITVEYPGGRVEKLFDKEVIFAKQLMAENPGHFVAALSVNHNSAHQSSYTSFRTSKESSPSTISSRQPSNSHDFSISPSFQLLPADAALSIRNRYRLLSFQEVFTQLSQGSNGCGVGRVNEVGISNVAMHRSESVEPCTIDKYYRHKNVAQSERPMCRRL